jgi:hypothetical protein
MSQFHLDSVKKAFPFSSSKPGDFRNCFLNEADREHRDYNYSLTVSFRQLLVAAAAKFARARQLAR